MKTIEQKIGLIPGAKDTFKRYLKIGLGLLMLGAAQAQAAEAITFYHNDLLGSPVAVTDINGDLCWREDYKPYGEKIRNDDDHQPVNPLCGFDGNQRGYTNHVHDRDIGLTYMQARYYDPAIGRFMGIDPIAIDLNERTTFNRYAYGGNNPHKYKDPDGKFIVLALAPPVLETAGYVLGGLLLGAFVFETTVEPMLNEKADKPVESPEIDPSEIEGKTPAEIDKIAKDLGLLPKGPAPEEGKGAYIDPVTGKQRVLVHPDAVPPHAHLNDEEGNRLDVNGNVVDNDSEDAHLGIDTEGQGENEAK